MLLDKSHCDADSHHHFNSGAHGKWQAEHEHTRQQWQGFSILRVEGSEGFSWHLAESFKEQIASEKCLSFAHRQKDRGRLSSPHQRRQLTQMEQGLHTFLASKNQEEWITKNSLLDNLIYNIRLNRSNYEVPQTHAAALGIKLWVCYCICFSWSHCTWVSLDHLSDTTHSVWRGKGG